MAILPLRLYWNYIRQDNFTTASPEGRRDAEAPGSGYEFIRFEGTVNSEPIPARPPGTPATVPLYLFYSRERQDNFTAASEEGYRNAKDANYELIRIEGHVYPYDPTGRRPALRLYYNQARGDNFTTASPEGIRSAEAPGSGYQFIRIEGYLINLGTEVGVGT